MSVEFFHGERVPATAGGPKHTVILFGGWGRQNGGNRLPENSVTGVAKLRSKLTAGDTQARIGAWQGEISGDIGTHGAKEFFLRHFDPTGKLIIYGYSAGAFNAMRLSYHLWAAYQAYELNTGKFRREMISASGPSSSGIGRLRVDLLVTVDAATGPTSGAVSRRVFPAVLRNLNIFQLHPSGRATSGRSSETGPGSHGGPNNAIDEDSTKVSNINWSRRYKSNGGRAHSRIDEDSIDLVVAEIQATLGASQS